MNELVHMCIDGNMAQILHDIAQDTYGPYVTRTNKRQPILYVHLEKALYGTLQAALLFWEKLSALLVSWGFELNPYDTCVANKHINGSICTILWHVDDLKISHVDPAVVDEIIAQLSDEFGCVAPLSVHRGKQHDYLGMQLDFSTPSKIRITMIDYIKKFLMKCLQIWREPLLLQQPTIFSQLTLNLQSSCHLTKLNFSIMLWHNYNSYVSMHARTFNCLSPFYALESRNLILMITKNWPELSNISAAL
jgi:Reverse transcriptase (RNA-dependent DNA polymerase)